MAYTQAQLDALDAALAAGVLTVEYDGRRTTYRSQQDMERQRAIMARQLAGAAAPAAFSLASFRRPG